MTSVDMPRFKGLMERMARAFGKKTDDVAVADLFEDLRDIELGVLEDAAQELRQNASYMPRVVQWRMAAQKAKARQTASTGRTQPRVVTLEDGQAQSAFFCLQCEDTGWRPDCGCDIGRLELFTARCPAHGPSGEEKRRMAVRACGCRPNNPAWQQQHSPRYVDESVAGRN